MNFNDVKRFQIPTIDWPYGTNAHEVRDMKGNILWPLSIKETYTQLEYIQADGSQYVDLGFALEPYPNYQYNIQMQMALDASSGNDFILGGCRNLALYRSNRYFYVKYNNTSYQNLSYTVTAGSSFFWSIEGSRFRLGNYLTLRHSSSRVDPEYTMKLFYDDTNNMYARGKIYRFSVYDNTASEYIVELIPAVRGSDGVLGMYDIQNNTFYEGTGDFIPGPEVGPIG